MAESDLIRGNVDTVILKVLYEGDRYGYDMIKQINARSGGQWEIKQPTLYACLKRLEKQGFVASYWDASESNGGRRKYYSLTDSGREVFVSYKNEWERSRDLFGELITNDEPILPADDFSDVEDDEYEVPKRKARPNRSRMKKADDVQNTSVEYVPPEYDENQYVHSVASEAQDQQDQSANTAQPQANEPDRQEQTNTVNDEITETAESDISDGYVQQSLFDYVENSENEPADERNAQESSPSTADDRVKPAQPAEEPPARPTADPRAIIEELYASTYTGNRSYAEARNTLYGHDDVPERKDATAPAVQPAPAPVPAPAKPAEAPAAAEDKDAPVPPQAALQPYGNALPQSREEESLARREYKDILSDLVNSCEARNDGEAEQAAAAAVTAQDDRIEVRRFDSVRQSVAELGNEVTVRSHNDSAKQYTHKYYYYSNRLLFTQYKTMCAIMFVLGLTLFLTFFAGLDMRMQYDYILYMFAGLLPIVMFVASIIIYAADPDKKKRINVNFRFSIIIRCVIMLQALVIIYCFNLIWGMPVSFSAAYVPSLVLPAMYAVFIPVSKVIFMTLLKSQHYAVE